MTINNHTAYIENLWDWGIFEGCFGNTRIEPTDIDGLVERKGKFLVIETKASGTPVPKGQQITFQSMLRTGVFTVVIVWGEPGTPDRMQIMTRQEIREPEPVDLDGLRRLVMRWFEWADKCTTTL